LIDRYAVQRLLVPYADRSYRQGLDFDAMLVCVEQELGARSFDSQFATTERGKHIGRTVAQALEHHPPRSRYVPAGPSSER
jgi:hypothetical protein